MNMFGGKTGWPEGMLQDDCKKLSKWLSNRLGARRQVKENVKSFKGTGGASFCHFCMTQLQWKGPKEFYFKMMLTPHDEYPVRVHVGCINNAIDDGYRIQPGN